MSAPFVGRGRELDAISALLRQSRPQATPAAALITGEPGSGKTRLMAEAVERSPSPGRIHAVGFEPIQPTPFAATGELLRRLARVPGQGPTLDALVFGTEDPARNDPLRIFEAAHRALTSFGSLLLTVDDLQWVDEQSLGLIHYLLQAAGPARQQLVVIAAARHSPAAAAFRSSAQAATSPERFASIELGPLPLEEGIWLARATDRSLSRATAEDLWRRAGGSPFWLEALAQAGVRDDPSSVLGERLLTLSGDAGALLATLAVAARPFPIETLAVVLAWQTDRVRYAGRELVTRGLVIEAEGSLRLAHDLIREAAIHALPAAARQRLHIVLAEHIEAEAGDDVQLLCEALEHRAIAGRAAPELALRVVESPRRRLLGTQNIQLLASISDSLEPDASRLQLRLDARLAELAAALGEQELALARWTRVSDRSDDPQQAQDAQIEAARAAHRLGWSEEAHLHLDLARTSTARGLESAVRIDALQAEIELWSDHLTDAGSRTAERALRAAYTMAAATGGVDRLSVSARRSYLEALEAAGDAALQQERSDDVLRLSEESVAVGRSLDEEAYIGALLRTGLAIRPLGRVRESEAHFRRAWDLSRRVVLPTATLEAGHGLARALRDLGRLAEARAIAAETVELEDRLGHPPGRWGNASAILHVIELSLGQPGALQTLRDDARAETNPHYQLAIHEKIAIWQARNAGERLAGEVVSELAAARAAAASARCPRCSAELSVVGAEALARIGRIEEAGEELRLWKRQERSAYSTREIWGMSAEAAIAMARADTEEATALLEGLATRLERIGLVEDVAWTRIDLGRLLGREDRAGAVEAFSEAAALSERIGAKSLSRLAAQGLRELGVRAWRRGRAAAGDGLGSLSDREQEVARLAAQGASNREIAAALLVSPKTVERHLTNVLAKLGLRNRTELAATLLSAHGTGFSR